MQQPPRRYLETVLRQLLRSGPGAAVPALQGVTPAIRALATRALARAPACLTAGQCSNSHLHQLLTLSQHAVVGRGEGSAGVPRHHSILGEQPKVQDAVGVHDAAIAATLPLTNVLHLHNDPDRHDSRVTTGKLRECIRRMQPSSSVEHPTKCLDHHDDSVSVAL